ncbi:MULTISPECIES: DivIVA domain-containing protein [Cohnella]|uniref:DivIVA domain-containing protein n=1 Tax=Cohnella hashimotonis TaxID=2826895 RepID=A0ABT6TAQ4_9BACL|nr:DivIVA domain-containing protein [Cohnella hashimotonis]MDI4643730.1 DivIVA domain-containing protein [Cohnella hashimotonis]
MSVSPKLQQLLTDNGVSFTALDVFNQEFDKGRMMSRRYDADQVDAFLDKVVKDYERLYKLLGDMEVEVEAFRESITNKAEMSVEHLHVRLRKIEHYLQNKR